MRFPADKSLGRLGLVRTSLIDFPGRVSAVVFTTGCNFRCPFCHNADLALGKIPATFVSREETISHLRTRRDVLDGVVITGGEPLLHEALDDLVAEIRFLGLAVKIDTNGFFPERLAGIAPDYVAVDIKCAPERYQILAQVPGAADRLAETIRYVLESGTPHEFRTTVVPGLVDERGIDAIAEMIRGADRFVLNEFSPESTLDPRLSRVAPYSKAIFVQYKRTIEKTGTSCTIRGPSFV